MRSFCNPRRELVGIVEPSRLQPALIEYVQLLPQGRKPGLAKWGQDKSARLVTIGYLACSHRV